MQKVFDFGGGAGKEDGAETVVTYETFLSENRVPTENEPLFVLEGGMGFADHQNGVFTNPHRRTSFEAETESGKVSADILKVDKRFVSLLEWLGEKRISVRLHGREKEEGFAVYRLRTVDPSSPSNAKTTEDAFLQMVIEHLLLSSAPEEIDWDDSTDQEEVLLSDMATMTDFVRCAGTALPSAIRDWAVRTVKLIKANNISPEERRHAQRALSMVLNVKWKNAYFESIDPVAARAILDEELYGLEQVKTRVIETIIQINRTHTLPFYGLLLLGPAGTGKSQVAYAVARILKLPWTSLDMSAIRDAESLTGSPRMYANAKPGRIMEAFSLAGSSNLVFIINELDKADSNTSTGNPADALLTLLDNLGYTDNYIECTIPTGGVYPIATANEKQKISAPLMSRFAVIEIPDYTPDEKKIIFSDFSLPKILKRMHMQKEECVVLPEAVDVIVNDCMTESGCRDLEQAAEHLAAHALYLIETTGCGKVVYDALTVRELLGGRKAR